jgi:hypothetical protein
MATTRLVYFSENRLDQQQSTLRQLSAILSVSNRNNRGLGLTGALVFNDVWFLQVLEGDRRDVWQQFERIKDDDRHANVVLAEMREVPERLFANWWMGLVVRNASNEDVFASFTKDRRFDPHSMSADEILRLMIELAKLGFSRELAPKVA